MVQRQIQALQAPLVLLAILVLLAQRQIQVLQVPLVLLVILVHVVLGLLGLLGPLVKGLLLLLRAHQHFRDP